MSQVQFTAEQIGTGKLHVQTGSENIRESPIVMRVKPLPIDPESCVAGLYSVSLAWQLTTACVHVEGHCLKHVVEHAHYSFHVFAFNRIGVRQRSGGKHANTKTIFAGSCHSMQGLMSQVNNSDLWYI